MQRNFYSIFLLCAVITGLLTGCGKDDPKPSKGKLEGVITDALTGGPLSAVKVIIFNADDNAPTGSTLTSDASGNFSTSLAPGNYFFKLYKQGYDAVPAPGMEAVPFAVEKGATTEQTAEMFPGTSTNTGFISGKAVAGDKPLAGVLIVAEDNVNNRAYSSVSDAAGNYWIFNVPAGSYAVQGYVANYTATAADASVTSGTETGNINISLAGGASGTLTGSIRNLATDNQDVDVSLVHPLTKESIPGLTTRSEDLGYTITNIPDGTFIARATYKNDGRVMDPDRIAKFGEPVVTFSGSNTQQLVFDVTGSIPVTTPTNEPATIAPVEITTTVPTFEWNAYSSTSDYVIEVIDAASGTVIWGGFDKSGDNPVKNITIPSAQRSILFNADGKASISALVPGKIYRWRIYASKNDQNSATGWTLISASEDQLGLIQVTE